MFKLLVVDDEQIIRKGLIKKIRTLNLDVQIAGEAADGLEAVEMVQTLDPDIILTDMRMPEMDGVTLLKILSSKFPDKKLIVISGYSDFEYMKEAISANVVGYLLKPFSIEEIKQILEKAIAHIDKERSMRQKIGSIELEMDRINIISDITILSNAITNPHSEALNIDTLKHFDMSRFVSSKSYLLVSFYTKLLLNHEVLISKYYNNRNVDNSQILVPNPFNGHEFYLLLCFDHDDVSSIINKAVEKARSLIQQLKSCTQEPILTGISGIKHQFQNYYQAYLESLSAINTYEVNSINNILIYSRSKRFKEYTWGYEDQLIFFIESGNVSQSQELISRLFEYIESKSAITLMEVKGIFKAIFNEICSLLTKHSVYSDNLASFNFDTQVEKVYDIALMKSGFKQFLTDSASIIKDMNIYPSDELIVNVKKYIDSNFHKDLSLEKISELFFINPSYLSFIFKEKSGENFSDYLIKVRIDYAKHLLSTTENKINKISKLIGYSNAKYFYRVFKRLTGYTPEEYRKNPQ